tara:strand:- start:108 stop:350 length:243 start_codon:yes stop_codon:yes gene_type:complete
MNITDRSLEVFTAYAKDACNWSGTPLVGGNVRWDQEAADRGNITQLKKAKLIETATDEGCTWILFTDDGKALAESMGIDI